MYHGIGTYLLYENRPYYVIKIKQEFSGCSEVDKINIGIGAARAEVSLH